MTSASCAAPRCPLGSGDNGEAEADGGGAIESLDDCGKAEAEGLGGTAALDNGGDSAGDEEVVGAEASESSGSGVVDCEKAGAVCKKTPASVANTNPQSRETSET